MDRGVLRLYCLVGIGYVQGGKFITCVWISKGNEIDCVLWLKKSEKGMRKSLYTRNEERKSKKVFVK